MLMWPTRLLLRWRGVRCFLLLAWESFSDGIEYEKFGRIVCFFWMAIHVLQDHSIFLSHRAFGGQTEERPRRYSFVACGLPESHSHIEALKHAIDGTQANSIHDRSVNFPGFPYAQKII